MQFLDYVQEKHVHGQIMEIQNNLESSKETYELIQGGPEVIEEGGINLIDQDDANQREGKLQGLNTAGLAAPAFATLRVGLTFILRLNHQVSSPSKQKSH